MLDKRITSLISRQTNFKTDAYIIVESASLFCHKLMKFAAAVSLALQVLMYGFVTFGKPDRKIDRNEETRFHFLKY